MKFTSDRPTLGSSPSYKRPENYSKSKRPRLESSKQLEDRKRSGNDNMQFAKSQTRKNLLPFIIDPKTKEKVYMDEGEYGAMPYSIKNMDELLKVTPWHKEYRRSSSPFK
jgi:hypothetical protein